MSTSLLSGSTNLGPALPLARLSNRATINGYIKTACLGFSAIIFVAWQYALRDGRTIASDPQVWYKVDRRLPRRALGLTRRFLEKNFYLTLGDERRKPWTLITSAFSHIDFWHFLANATSFNSFSKLLAIFLPPVHFAGVILTSALAGSAAFLLQQSREKPSYRRVRALGMSAVTSGMGAMAAYLFPHAIVSLNGIDMQIWAAAAGYFAWDVFFLNSQQSTTGHAAHVGGSLAGLGYGAWLVASGVVPARRSRTRF